jgi:hypothetical protein
MAYLILSDNSPEADEYDCGRLYFDETDPDVVGQISRVLSQSRSHDPSAIKALKEICDKSLARKKLHRKTFFSRIFRFSGCGLKPSRKNGLRPSIGQTGALSC